MKKFLSLVLALIMTMSLVTISAGATEYRDLTDKDEIQYEEAVAVLNRIGVITGYEDGSFRPEGELTRGAAAKIIVSLLIGPDAAANLPNATAPYPDVPASHTFAGVISYCKTAGIISGYGDGTFKPGNSLTGFAFAKMLLGALGYKSEIEGFVDTGWTMNVAKVGNVAGLFDRLDFDGAGAVNRETACQLALNTLKATMVTYGGTTLVTGAQTLAVQGTQAMYVTSNNREINANINRRVISAQNNEMTLEFGEEHFKDLRLEHDKYDPAYDDFGRPSNEWSYKKVTIGTFKLPADFTYTTQISYREDSVATKEKALGLRGYDTYSTDHQANYTNWSSPAGGSYRTNSPFDNATQITINGYDARANTKTGVLYAYEASDVANKDGAPTLAEIADLTDNGVTVEVYVCPVDADFITNVVVVRTQLMNVKRVGADYVTLERLDPDSRDPRKAGDLPAITGYNAFAIDEDTIDVKDNNYDAYNALKDLKAGDRVAVIPFTADQGKTWEVGEAYVPETVSGRLTDVGLYMNTSKTDGNATSITIGGTKYVINEWNADMIDVKKAQINATRKDVTAYLAKDGTVLWTTEIGNSDAWMIVGDYYQAANTSGKVVWYAHGWTIGGEEVNIDLGTIRGEAEKYAPGELVHYELAEGGTGEYKLEKPNANGVSRNYADGTVRVNNEPVKTKDDKVTVTGEGIYNVAQFVKNGGANTPYKIHPANSLIPLEGYWNSTTGNATSADRTAVGGAIFKNETDTARDGTTVARNPRADATLNTPLVQAGAHTWNYRSTTYKDDGVKFIYVSFDLSTGNVDYVSVRKDAQTVENKELAVQNEWWTNAGTNVNANSRNWVVSPAEAYVNKDGNVEAVVIKTEPAAADLSNVVVVGEYVGTETGKNLGAENASAIANSHTREYYQGPNFSEKKTGVFKNQHNTGDIVVIRSTDENGVMDCKDFNSNIFQNRNPDVIEATGVSPLKNAAEKTSKIAFYVGKEAAYTVTNQKGATNLKTALINGSLADFMTDLKTEAEQLEDLNELTDGKYAGLIKVAGAKWIDLRANRGSHEVESLSDLLDLKEDTVQIKVLMNAKGTTDTFRRAYAIVVMKGIAKDDVVEEGSQSLDRFATVKNVNDALANGNVTVTGNWTNIPVNLADDDVLRIPSGRTLTVNGNLDVSNLRGVAFGTNAKLVVSGNLTGLAGQMDGESNANVTANNVTIVDDCQIGGKMTVKGILTIGNGTDAATVDVLSGATVDVDKKVEVKTSGVLNIYGTVNVGSNTTTGDTTITGPGTINVLSTHSLHVWGSVEKVTIKTGNGNYSYNGLVNIRGTLKADATFVDANVHPATGTNTTTQVITTVKGTIEMSEDAKLTTTTFEPTKIKLDAGAEITLEQGTNKVSDDITFTTVSGTPLPNSDDKVTITVTTDVPSTTVSPGTVVAGDPVDESGSTVETTDPFEVSDTQFVQTEGEAANWIKNKDTKGQWPNQGVIDAHGKTTMPWLLSKLTATGDIPAGTVVTGTVYKNGAETTATDTWTAGTKTEGDYAIFHWEAVNGTADGINYLTGARGDLTGDYKIVYEWTINGIEGSIETPVVHYDEPGILSAGNVSGQAIQIDGKNITISKVIDVTGSEVDATAAGDGSNWNIAAEGQKGAKDVAAVVFTISSQSGIWSSDAEKVVSDGPHTDPVKDKFGANGRTGWALYFNEDTIADWKSGPCKATFILTAADTNAAVSTVTFEYSITLTADAIAQIEALLASAPEDPGTGTGGAGTGSGTGTNETV